MAHIKANRKGGRALRSTGGARATTGAAMKERSRLEGVGEGRTAYVESVDTQPLRSLRAGATPAKATRVTPRRRGKGEKREGDRDEMSGEEN